MSFELGTPNTGLSLSTMSADSVRIIWQKAIDIFEQTKHRYTRALIDSIPRIDQPSHTRLRTIPGRPPDLLAPHPGCPFAPRCEFAIDRCHAEMPPLVATRPGHDFACWVPIDHPVEKGDA